MFQEEGNRLGAGEQQEHLGTLGYSQASEAIKFSVCPEAKGTFSVTLSQKEYFESTVRPKKTLLR